MPQGGSGDPDGFLDPRQANTIPQDLQDAIVNPIVTMPTVAPQTWIRQIPFVGQLDSGTNLQMAEVAPKIFFGFQQNAQGNQRVRSGFIAARRLPNGTFAKLTLPGNVFVMGYDGQSVLAIGEQVWNSTLSAAQAGTPSWQTLDTQGILSPGVDDPMEPDVVWGDPAFPWTPTPFDRQLACWGPTCAFTTSQFSDVNDQIQDELRGQTISLDGGRTWVSREMWQSEPSAVVNVGDRVLTNMGLWTDTTTRGGCSGLCDSGVYSKDGAISSDTVHWSQSRQRFIGMIGDTTSSATPTYTPKSWYPSTAPVTLAIPSSVPGTLQDVLELADGTPFYLSSLNGQVIVTRGTTEVFRFASLDATAATFGPYAGTGFVTIIPGVFQTYTLASSYDSGATWTTAPRTLVVPPNQPPVCSGLTATPNVLGPPNHQLVDVALSGVTDPDGDQVTITITSVTQDEPLNGTGDGDTSPDATVTGATLKLRAERAGAGDGRVYRVIVTATDTKGATCNATANVAVLPNNSGNAVDSGGTFNSLGQ